MTKSSLCSYTNITSNHSSGRSSNSVRKVTPHYMCAHWTGRQCADYFASTSRQASSNYCIGYDGDIAMSVDENDRAWTSSSGWNDRQAITIECANNSDTSLSDATYSSLVKLCADVCQRYGITPSYDGTTNGTFTEHRMYASTDCPGAWLHGHMSQLVEDVKKVMAGGTVSGGGSSSSSSSSSDGLGDTSWTGPKMLKELQRQLGTSVDGKLSNQSTYVRKNVLVRVESGCFDGNTSGSGGSSMVKALQRKIGTGVDGSFGHGTVKALQSWLNSKLGAGLDVDGYYGPATSRAVGTALTKKLFQ